ncbi:MetS family NSS transporter small subunit [Peptococcaceae bacterium 1198_IL3148]
MSGSAIAMMIIAMILLWGGASFFLIRAIKNREF